jgi:hypothetical protein
VLQPQNQLAHGPRGQRVEPGRRLIQEQDLWLVQQRPRQANLLLHSARKGGHALGAVRVELEQVEELIDTLAARGRVQSVQPTPELQIRPGCHLVVQPRRVGHHADARPDGSWLDTDVAPGDAGRPGRGRQQPRQHAHRRRLARAVWPEQR